MLTDVVFRRYQNITVWHEFTEQHRALIAQAAQLITRGSLFPFQRFKGSSDDRSRASLEDIHATLCRELGLDALNTRNGAKSRIGKAI
jgi:hypothetical protein